MKTRTIIIASVSAVVLAAATFLFVQYKKIMNYTIKFKSIKVKTITDSLVNFDLYLLFTNNSNISFDITQQRYKISVNNKEVATIGNASNVPIVHGDNIIPLAISFNPKKIVSTDAAGLQNALAFLMNIKSAKIKVEVSMIVSLYSFPVSIPFVYETSVSELIDSKK